MIYWWWFEKLVGNSHPPSYRRILTFGMNVIILWLRIRSQKFNLILSRFFIWNLKLWLLFCRLWLWCDYFLKIYLSDSNGLQQGGYTKCLRWKLIANIRRSFCDLWDHLLWLYKISKRIHTFCDCDNTVIISKKFS